MQEDYDPSYFYHERNECRDCLEKEQERDEAHEYLDEIIHQLYDTSAIDYTKLEHCLDELCHFLRVRPGRGDLQIERKQPPQQKFAVPKWINFPIYAEEQTA